MACRVLNVSTSGFYEWRSRPASARDESDAHLANKIRDIHAGSRGCYGAPRVHADLRLGGGIRTGRKRIARLMRMLGVAGI
ncbi:IS3 family transposase, partial [Tsukamurella pseudospumae]